MYSLCFERCKAKIFHLDILHTFCVTFTDLKYKAFKKFLKASISIL